VKTSIRIPPKQLGKLEEKVRSLMSEQRWQEGIQEIRDLAQLYGMDANELARQVANLAIERGHVQPLRQVDEL
jgi:hypothetical protein